MKMGEAGRPRGTGDGWQSFEPEARKPPDIEPLAIHQSAAV